MPKKKYGREKKIQSVPEAGAVVGKEKHVVLTDHLLHQCLVNARP